MCDAKSTLVTAALACVGKADATATRLFEAAWEMQAAGLRVEAAQFRCLGRQHRVKAIELEAQAVALSVQPHPLGRSRG